MSRTRLCFYLILLAPLLAYWPTIFHDYGLRDDYSHLREAREEPGKLVKFTTSQGRPLYGALLETSFLAAGQVENLRWLRLAGVALMTLVALAVWRQLYRSGWNELEAAVIGLGVALLPSAQIVAGWAIGWPYALALLLAVAGFAAIEAELERGGLKRAVALIGGALIYGVSGLIYQSNAMFAVALIGAVLLVRSGREPLLDWRWLAIHLGTLLVGLLGGYLVVKFLFSTGLFVASARMQFETAPLAKLGWFLSQPLPNAVALFPLRDSFGAGAGWFWLAALTSTAVIVAARWCMPEVQTRRKWLLAVALLPFAAHAVSLVAAERAVGYRVLFPLATLALVLVVFTLRQVRETQRVHRKVEYAALALLVFGGFLLARNHALTLLAEPQGREWSIIKAGVHRHAFKGETKVYVITPTLEDRSTTRVFADEFGSLTSDSDWAPREMVHAAMHDRFDRRLPKGVSYSVVLGRSEPAMGAYDLVLDMRQLKTMRAP